MGTELVLTVLLHKLTSLLVEEDERLWLTAPLHDEFCKSRDEFQHMISFLRDVDARPETEEVIRIWVKKLRNAAFDMEDILDDFTLHISQSPSLLYKACCFIDNLIICHWAKVHMRGARKRFHQISEDPHVRWRLHPISGDSGDNLIAGGITSSASDYRMISPLVEEDDLVGTQRARDVLLGWLVEEEQLLTTISVVGMDGSGKTALVKKIFNSTEVRKNFDCHAWVTVSQRYRMNKVLQSIMKQFNSPSFKDSDDWTTLQLAQHLHHHLLHKRYVIVLDDVWSIRFWEDIKHVLPNGECGSRVIITTGNSEVAMSTYGHVYHLQPLPFKDAWELFCKRAFPLQAQCPPDLEELSRNIVKRCGGLPLAIVVTGGFLSRKDRDVSKWEWFLRNLGSELESNPYFATLMRTIKLSYHDLPYKLKSCFLYMGIFPEDVPIRITRLIRLWTAEGFVQSWGDETQEVVAEDYFNDLVKRSLVHVSEFHDDGRPRSCQINELIHHMISSEAKEDSFAISYGEEDMRLYGGPRRLSIHNNFWSTSQLKRLHHLRLRSLLVFGEEKIFESAVAGNIPRFRLLKVLDLEGTHLKSFPTEIKNLLLLRYLSLRNTMITSLPKSLGKLVNIETLDLKGTGISVLPIEILKLKFLRHLLVGHHGKNDGVSVPKGIGKLSALLTLTCINVAGELAVISELGNLMQLMKLCIANLRREDGRILCSSIEKMDSLISFKAMLKNDNQLLDLPAISPTPPHLKRIHLNGRLEKLPDWIASLHNLVKMSLLRSRLKDDPLKILQSLRNLAVLTFSRAYDGEELCCEEYGLPNLKVLNLFKLDRLKSVRVEEGAMPCLQKLHFNKCTGLENIPFGIEHLTHLKELYLMNVPNALIKKIASDGGEDHWKVKHIELVYDQTSAAIAREERRRSLHRRFKEAVYLQDHAAIVTGLSINKSMLLFISLRWDEECSSYYYIKDMHVFD